MVSSLQVFRLKLARISDLDRTCYMPHDPYLLTYSLHGAESFLSS